MDWLTAVPQRYPAPGTVVSTWVYLFFRHRGIVSDRYRDGKPMVITNDPVHGVVEQMWDEFRSGQAVQIEGYPSRLPYPEVVRRARSLVGAPYHLFDFNCDQLTNHAHGRPLVSEQVQVAALAVAVAGIAAMFAARKR